MNKKIYLGVYVFSLALGLLAGALFIALNVFMSLSDVLYDISPTFYSVVKLLSLLGVIQLLIVYVVYTFALLAKMWGSIQDGYARTPPGKAIGFLFIPIFSIYWIFNVWGGFPTDYNSFVERHRLNVPRLSAGLFVMFPVFVLLSGLSFGLTLIINFFLLIAIISKVCDAVNAVADTTPGTSTVEPARTLIPSVDRV